MSQVCAFCRGEETTAVGVFNHRADCPDLLGKSGYAIRSCRDSHFHVTVCGHDIMLKGDPFMTVEDASKALKTDQGLSGDADRAASPALPEAPDFERLVDEFAVAQARHHAVWAIDEDNVSGESEARAKRTAARTALLTAIHAAIAQARRDERERCAKVADAWEQAFSAPTEQDEAYAAKRIAAALRQPPQEPEEGRQ